MVGTTRTGGPVGETPDPLYVVPSRHDLERALTSVSGVADAEVSRNESGRDRLRISLRRGADPDGVAWAVAATLRERFGIALDPAAIAVRQDAPDPPLDPPVHLPADAPSEPPAVDAEGFQGDPALVAAARAAVGLVGSTDLEDGPESTHAEPEDGPDGDAEAGARPRPAPRRGGAATPPPAPDGPSTPPPTPGSTPGPTSPAADAAGERSSTRRRAAIAELVAHPDGEDLSVLATLRLADQEVTGRARGLGTRRGRWRTIALATLDALGGLTSGRLRAEVDHITVLVFPDLSHVTVAVTLLGDHGEERFLGAAMVRDDPDRAVMRATLDAVNRRVEPWLTGQGRPA